MIVHTDIEKINHDSIIDETIYKDTKASTFNQRQS